ncbi:MAG: hypothetical protein MI753_16725, partial [Hyphomicrobiales bacterium]|nr:hypothetical protein [Hyphomicrobiales bacterium]
MLGSVNESVFNQQGTTGLLRERPIQAFRRTKQFAAWRIVQRLANAGWRAVRDENDGVDGSCTLRHWRFMMAVVVIGRKEPPHADFHHWSRYREEHFSGA